MAGPSQTMSSTEAAFVKMLDLGVFAIRQPLKSGGLLPRILQLLFLGPIFVDKGFLLQRPISVLLRVCNPWVGILSYWPGHRDGSLLGI